MNEVFLGGWVGMLRDHYFSPGYWIMGVNKRLEQGAELSRGQARYCYSVSKPQ